MLAPVFGSILLVPPASGYRIKGKGPQHERLTALAEQCLAAQPAGMPLRCPLPQSPGQFEETSWATSEYAEAARWPDDPTRQIYDKSIGKFGVNVGFDRCIRHLRKYLYAGLLCHSHYGRLQFFHAMRAGDESDGLTRARILAWTNFSFAVATGNADLDADYCGTLKGIPNLGDALAPPGFPFCAKPGTVPNERYQWKVRSLFSFRCGNVVTSGKCDIMPSGGDDRIPRLAATGALLHVIQDSFSQSHTARGGTFPRGPYSARVVCSPVSAFYRYDSEQAKVHKAGDIAPTFDAGCVGANVIDPVTATARMLWLVKNACHASWAVELIDRGVLGGSGASRVPLSAEACRLPTPVG